MGDDFSSSKVFEGLHVPDGICIALHFRLADFLFEIHAQMTQLYFWLNFIYTIPRLLRIGFEKEFKKTFKFRIYIYSST